MVKTIATTYHSLGTSDRQDEGTLKDLPCLEQSFLN